MASYLLSNDDLVPYRRIWFTWYPYTDKEIDIVSGAFEYCADVRDAICNVLGPSLVPSPALMDMYLSPIGNNSPPNASDRLKSSDLVSERIGNGYSIRPHDSAASNDSKILYIDLRRRNLLSPHIHGSRHRYMWQVKKPRVSSVRILNFIEQNKDLSHNNNDSKQLNKGSSMAIQSHEDIGINNNDKKQIISAADSENASSIRSGVQSSIDNSGYDLNNVTSSFTTSQNEGISADNTISSFMSLGSSGITYDREFISSYFMAGKVTGHDDGGDKKRKGSLYNRIKKSVKRYNTINGIHPHVIDSEDIGDRNNNTNSRSSDSLQECSTVDNVLNSELMTLDVSLVMPEVNKTDNANIGESVQQQPQKKEEGEHPLIKSAEQKCINERSGEHWNTTDSQIRPKHTSKYQKNDTDALDETAETPCLSQAQLVANSPIVVLARQSVKPPNTNYGAPTEAIHDDDGEMSDSEERALESAFSKGYDPYRQRHQLKPAGHEGLPPQAPSRVLTRTRLEERRRNVHAAAGGVFGQVSAKGALDRSPKPIYSNTKPSSAPCTRTEKVMSPLYIPDMTSDPCQPCGSYRSCIQVLKNSGVSPRPMSSIGYRADQINILPHSTVLNNNHAATNMESDNSSTVPRVKLRPATTLGLRATRPATALQWSETCRPQSANRASYTGVNMYQFKHPNEYMEQDFAINAGWFVERSRHLIIDDEPLTAAANMSDVTHHSDQDTQQEKVNCNINDTRCSVTRPMSVNSVRSIPNTNQIHHELPSLRQLYGKYNQVPTTSSTHARTISNISIGKDTPYTKDTIKETTRERTPYSSDSEIEEAISFNTNTNTPKNTPEKDDKSLERQYSTRSASYEESAACSHIPQIVDINCEKEVEYRPQGEERHDDDLPHTHQVVLRTIVDEQYGRLLIEQYEDCDMTYITRDAHLITALLSCSGKMLETVEHNPTDNSIIDTDGRHEQVDNMSKITEDHGDSTRCCMCF